MSAADIHRQITEVYGTEAMSDSNFRKWARKFKDVRTNVHDEENSNRPSVITDDMMQAVKLCFRWVPRLLTADHKEKRFAILLDFLIRYEEADDMLSRIVTGDETWLSQITPESKHLSMEWQQTSSPVKDKAKQLLSKRKIWQHSGTGAVFY
ncbi:mariner Mos1 transposase [Trichonephila clavipes]|nr:mariner Mos1 transposase [Trichonephila clavipes]